jgi:hypothetical protein
VIAPGELSIQRRLTRVFIAADSVSISLHRNEKVPDGKGGYRTVKTDLPLQVFRLIPSGDGATERLTADGKQVTPSYMLMGEWTCDLARGDTFERDGRRYEVVFINENRQYEIKGEVAYLGE